jgi:hypothetical protein
LKKRVYDDTTIYENDNDNYPKHTFKYGNRL